MSRKELTLFLGEELLSLLKGFSPQMLNRLLRDIYLDYLYHAMETGRPKNFDEEMFAMQEFFVLLDKAEDKMQECNE